MLVKAMEMDENNSKEVWRVETEEGQKGLGNRF